MYRFCLIIEILVKEYAQIWGVICRDCLLLVCQPKHIVREIIVAWKHDCVCDFRNRYIIAELRKSLDFPARNDECDSLRNEYSDILKNQQSKGNNGLSKAKYVTFGIETDNYKAAKLRTERVEADILNNFKILGVSARSLTGAERLEVMHGQFHPDGTDKFRFD